MQSSAKHQVGSVTYADTFEEEKHVAIKITLIEINRLKGKPAGAEKQMNTYLKESEF